MQKANAAFLVFCLAIAPWLSLLHGQYLFDDVQLVESNRRLMVVDSLPSVFRFSLKPSKPLSNVALALGQWMGKGRVEGQRVLSLALHGCVALLLFLLLSEFTSVAVAAAAAVIFGWLPIHAESLAVSWFRMDMVGTGFTLFACLLARKRRWVGVFLAVFAAALTKEIFVLLAPACVALFSRRLSALWLAAPCALVVGWLLMGDGASEYPYRGVVGPGVLGGRQWFLAPLASGEWLVKSVSGVGLTTTSLLERWEAAPSVARALGLGTLGALTWICLGLSVRERNPWSDWSAAALMGLLIYAFIPNVNVGAERYGYFPAAFALGALVLAAASQISDPRRVIGLAAVWAVLLLIPLRSRAEALRTRMSHFSAEVQSHPEVGTNWSNAASAVLELQGDGFLDDAAKWLGEARRRSPEHPRVILAEFLYRFRRGDPELYSQWLLQQGPRFAADRRMLADLEFQLGVLQARRGRCTEAKAQFHRAERRDARLLGTPRPFCG